MSLRYCPFILESSPKFEPGLLGLAGWGRRQPLRRSFAAFDKTICGEFEAGMRINDLLAFAYQQARCNRRGAGGLCVIELVTFTDLVQRRFEQDLRGGQVKQ